MPWICSQLFVHSRTGVKDSQKAGSACPDGNSNGECDCKTRFRPKYVFGFRVLRQPLSGNFPLFWIVKMRSKIISLIMFCLLLDSSGWTVGEWWSSGCANGCECRHNENSVDSKNSSRTQLLQTCVFRFGGLCKLWLEQKDKYTQNIYIYILYNYIIYSYICDICRFAYVFLHGYVYVIVRVSLSIPGKCVIRHMPSSRLRTAEAELQEASKREQVRTPGDVESARFFFFFRTELTWWIWWIL